MIASDKAPSCQIDVEYASFCQNKVAFRSIFDHAVRVVASLKIV